MDERSVESADTALRLDPVALARRLAAAKADAVAGHHPADWVLGADQVAHHRGEAFGKPTDRDDHLRRLRSLRGDVHELVTAWSLRGPGAPADGVVTTRMLMRSDIEDDELADYVASGEGSGCAGGYRLDGQGAFLFESVDGDWFNVVGLPLLDVWTALRARGWRRGRW